MKRERIVVVGNGMAATRFAEEVIARGVDAQITIVGAERGPAYNRILLSAVLEGTHPVDELTLRHPQWYDVNGIDLVTGMRVVDVDRDRRLVLLDNDTAIPYDRLVLATGAIPTLPPIRGLITPDGTLDERVHAFRSIADCLRLSRSLPERGRAVVVGGGLLGLQVARALAMRGLEVDLVEGTGHLLSQNVGEPAGNALRRSLARLGTEVYTNTRAVKLTPDGLAIDTGYVIPTDLVVLTAGGRPSTALARRCGLEVRRGVVVDERLTSVSDERVHAIGDCAESGGVTTGFVSPAWDQARLLADLVAGVDVTYDGSRNVARLRATDLDVAVIGDPLKAVGEVVEVANPIRGSYRRLTVIGGVIEAGVLVGDLSRIGLITQLYDRRTVLGANEPGQLLMGDRAAVVDTQLPDDAEVCACAGVSAGAIRACHDLGQVRLSTRATTGCGGCTDVVRRLLEHPVAVNA
jgi:NAD(P)H-nitrite reductase large subunit